MNAAQLLFRNHDQEISCVIVGFDVTITFSEQPYKQKIGKFLVLNQVILSEDLGFNALILN